MTTSFFDRFSTVLFGSTPNRNRSPGMDYKSPFLMSWNIGSLVTLLFPLLLFLIFFRDRREGGEAEERNWWWNWGGNNDNNNNNNNDQQDDGQSWWQRMFGGDRDDPERQGNGGVMYFFLYLYVIAIFGGLVWYGNRILRRGAFTLPLLTAMCVFMNMAFLMAIVLGITKGDERQREEGRSGMSVLVALTCAATAIFITVFFLMIRFRDHEYGVEYSGQLDPDYNGEAEKKGTQFHSMDDGGDTPQTSSYSYNRERKLAAAEKASNRNHSGLFV